MTIESHIAASIELDDAQRANRIRLDGLRDALARDVMLELVRATAREHWCSTDTWEDGNNIARNAYGMADAMMRAREVLP